METILPAMLYKNIIIITILALSPTACGNYDGHRT